MTQKKKNENMKYSSIQNRSIGSPYFRISSNRLAFGTQINKQINK